MRAKTELIREFLVFTAVWIGMKLEEISTRYLRLRSVEDVGKMLVDVVKMLKVQKSNMKIDIITVGAKEV